VNNKPETIKIDEVEYVRKDSLSQPAETLSGMKYVIVRTQSAGVFAGYIKSKYGQEVTMKTARRLWYWVGAASLSQLAMEGVSSPDSCKFPIAVDTITLTQTIEIIECTQRAKESIEGVKIWQV
jgi:hypothetical protein